MKRIPLKRRDGSVVAYARVSATDYQWLSRWTWRLATNGYAKRTEGTRVVLMHRAILGLPFGDARQGDHISRDKLDCRRSNLRIAARAELDNMQNQGLRSDNESGYRGVTWDRWTGRWVARCTVAGRQYNAGRYSSAHEADAAARAFRAVHMPFSDDAQEAAA